jgi:hypothetical protein
MKIIPFGLKKCRQKQLNPQISRVFSCQILISIETLPSSVKNITENILSRN